MLAAVPMTIRVTKRNSRNMKSRLVHMRIDMSEVYKEACGMKAM